MDKLEQVCLRQEKEHAARIRDLENTYQVCVVCVCMCVCVCVGGGGGGGGGGGMWGVWFVCVHVCVCVWGGGGGGGGGVCGRCVCMCVWFVCTCACLHDFIIMFRIVSYF